MTDDEASSTMGCEHVGCIGRKVCAFHWTVPLSETAAHVRSLFGPDHLPKVTPCTATETVPGPVDSEHTT